MSWFLILVNKLFTSSVETLLSVLVLTTWKISKLFGVYCRLLTIWSIFTIEKGSIMLDVKCTIELFISIYNIKTREYVTNQTYKWIVWFSSLALSYFSFCFEQKQYFKFNSFLTLKLFFLILQHYIFKKLSSINTSIVHVFSSFFFLGLFVAIWLFMKLSSFFMNGGNSSHWK